MINAHEKEPVNRISQGSWDDLVVSAQAGMQGGGAHVEAMRRVVLAVKRFSESSDTYSRRMWWLSIVIGFFALVQAAAAVKSIFIGP